MANPKDIKITLYPNQYLDSWIKNSNPLSGFINTKKIKGFIPKQNGFLKEDLFTIDTKNFDFKNSDNIKKELINLYSDVKKLLDLKLLDSFFNKTSKIFQNKTLNFTEKQETLDLVTEEFQKNNEFLNSLSTYLIVLFFSSTNFSSCYFFKELRSKKVEKIDSKNQRFLIKNQILIFSTILNKTESETSKLITDLFKDEVKKEELKKEIQLFRKQMKVYRDLFSLNKKYDLKFYLMNPRFMMPIFNVPLGTEIYKKYPYFYLQSSPEFVLTFMSKTENKEGVEKKQPIQIITINDFVSRKNPSTELYWYKGAIINFFKMIKPEKIVEWFNQKDYPILLRKNIDGKEEIVKLADDFVAKFDEALLGINKNDKPSTNSNKSKGNDNLTTDLDDIY